ncbi:restriction endonuclease subunit S [Candidatus Micrarchaeota archaeon]|nr:restriction endonuclease subunit S [Candidatus Micrarchaeota archaeon]
MTDIVPFGSIVDITKGKKVDITNQKTERSVPYLLIDTLRGAKPEFFTEDKNYTEAINSDILMVFDGANSGLVGTGLTGAVGSTIARLRPKKDVNTKYLTYFLCLNFSSLNQDIKGSAIPHIKPKKLAELKLRYPSKEEQELISQEIEKQLSRLDEAVTSLKAVKQKLNVYRKSVFKAAFEGEFSRRWRKKQSNLTGISLEDLQLQRMKRAMILKNQKSTLSFGEWKKKHILPIQIQEKYARTAPSNWLWVNLGEVFDVYVGSTPNRSKKEYWGGNIPWVSSGEVAFCSIYDTKEKITSVGFENSSTKLHPKGTVLLGMIGEGKTRGQVAILEIEACNNQNSAAIRVSEVNQSPKYVYYYLSFIYEKNRKLGSGNNQKALNKERVQIIPILLPPLLEQEVITNEIEARFSVIKKLEETIDRSLLKAEKLKKSILKSAFEGRLVEYGG